MGEASELFVATFGTPPEVVVRAPGRVNLIGEHTDYSNLPVMPMAVQLGIDVVAAASDGPIEAVSAAEPGRAAIAPDTRGWGRYLWGVVGALGERVRGRGAWLAVSGDLPSTGGLASSSALSVGVLAALNEAWGLGLHGSQIVDIAIVAERHVGVESGGMDQTAIAFAEAGSALRIDFEPPSRRPVPVPDGLSFVIGYSGFPAPKKGAARDHYNRSVVSCRAAAALLAREMGMEVPDRPRLRLVVDAPEDAVAGLPERITGAEAATSLNVPVELLTDLTAAAFDPQAELTPRRAAHHVLSEAKRVDEAEAAIGAGDGSALGALFAASHASLRVFGATTPGLDEVAAAAVGAGAWGARLTGAGFGGWAVAVCSPLRVAGVAAAMAGAAGGPALAVEPSAGVFSQMPRASIT